MFKYTLLALFLFLAQPSFTCDCQPLRPLNNRQYNSYDLIVMGKIKKVVEGTEVNTIYIKVRETYRGMPKKKIIAITTPTESFRCGIAPRRGDAWLMYARKYKGRYNTNQCMRSKPLARRAGYYARKSVLEGDLAFLAQKIN